MTSRNVLATDLDGTLIPLMGNAENLDDLSRLTRSIRENRIPLVFVTGRHLESVKTAIVEYRLPEPDCIICDVGATVCQRSETGWETVADYATEMQIRLNRESLRDARGLFADSDVIRLQEPVKQSDFKMSFYVDAEHLASARDQLEKAITDQGIDGTIVASVDPFNGDGLLDVLPNQVSKAFALDWWCHHQGWSRPEIVFAGDSGNDLAALTAGYRTIVVGNAQPDLVQQVRERHRQNRWDDRLHVCKRDATSGVVEGCQHFNLF